MIPPDNFRQNFTPPKLYRLWTLISPWMQPTITVVVFIAAFVLLRFEFKGHSIKQIGDSVRSLSSIGVAAAVLLTALNYLVMIGYDWLAIKSIGFPISGKKIATVSLLSYAFSNSLGTLLGGTPIRVRLYSAWGMQPKELVRLLFLISFAFWIGLITLAGILFTGFQFPIPPRFHLPISNSLGLGCCLLAISILLFGSCFWFRTPIHLFSINLQPPRLPIAVAQAILSAIDFLLAASTLYVLLPANIGVDFATFMGIFILAIVIGHLSHVPGGLGVFELVLTGMLPNASHQLVASLLAFRLIYYVAPLILAVGGLAIASLKQHSRSARLITEQAMTWTNLIGPRLITGAVFIAGILLLASGALPSDQGRMGLVRNLLPLPVVEISHFLGSVAGAMLLILARGLQRRIDLAWWLSILLLGFGAIFSLAKGFDYEEAAILAFLCLALLPCRSYFYRTGRLWLGTASLGWIAMLLMVVGLMTWLVLFAYQHVEYQDDLWWSFAYHADAPRSLRGLVAAAMVLSLLATLQLFRPRATPPDVAHDEQLQEVQRIVVTDRSTNSNLALLGDKRFIFSQDRKAFVMFGCQGGSWIAMGDPVGAESSRNDAAWRFREACDAAGVLTVFYQVEEKQFSRYIEMGLSIVKIGEDARIPLSDFSLEGNARKDLRRSLRKGADQGLQFRIVRQPEAGLLLPEFKAISDAWLKQKSVGEKQFSLGSFDEDYLMRNDFALVYQEERLLAFANLWYAADKEELSIDLMRHVPDSANGVMEYLFAELLLWGKSEGYQWFNLGMAPLAGVESRRLSPTWNRVSSLIYLHGEHFYNFKGLRSYKEKFAPVWTPRYLASPGGLATPQVLANLSTLISGGLLQLLKR